MNEKIEELTVLRIFLPPDEDPIRPLNPTVDPSDMDDHDPLSFLARRHLDSGGETVCVVQRPDVGVLPNVLL